MTTPSTWRFVITGAACPQLPLRLLGLFAQRELIPRDVAIRCADDTLAITVIQDALDAHHAGIIAAKMRALVMVRDVREERWDHDCHPPTPCPTLPNGAFQPAG